MAKNEGKSFWSIVGVFMTIWGITELNGGAVWILTCEHLFPLFIVELGITMVAMTLWSV